jgi:DNA-binding response OmpR family regulator
MQAKRVLLVNDGGRGGSRLEQLLAARGWSATRAAHEQALSLHAMAETYDVVVVVLDDDDIDVLETLIRLSAAPCRPPVVLLTRRSRSCAYSTLELRLLGVDRVVAWPCTTEAVADGIDKAWTEAFTQSIPGRSAAAQ